MEHFEIDREAGLGLKGGNDAPGARKVFVEDLRLPDERLRIRSA